MSFTLHVHFVGLCMFVPTPSSAQEKAMRVLMPAAAGHDHSGPHGSGDHPAASGHDLTKPVEEHVTRIVIDAGFLDEDSGTLSSIYALIPLTRQDLRISGATAAPALELPPVVLHHDKINPGAQIKESALSEKDTDKLLNARVVLLDGNPTVNDDNVMCFNLREQGHADKPTPSTNRVEWTIQSAEEHLELAWTPLEGGKAEKPVCLFPIRDPNGKNVIKLEIFHTPRHELPPDVPDPGPKDDMPAEHFHAFYRLFINTPHVKTPHLKLYGLCGEAGAVGDKASRPYTCLTSQAAPA